MFNILRTRKGKLKERIDFELSKEKPDIDNILNFIDVYEKANLDTIEKLRREKSAVVRKINGALRQAINAHGPITKELIGSASKRIYGSLLVEKKITFFDKVKKFFK